jgi:hypothetical protein
MVATQKLAKDDLVSRVTAKNFRPRQTEAARELRVWPPKPGGPLPSSKACRETRDGHANLCWIMPGTAPATLLTEIAGHPRNGLEPKAIARVASLFPPDLFHPLLAFLQRHL